MKESTIEVDIWPLQTQQFTGAQAVHRGNTEKRSPGFFGDRKYFVELIDSPRKAANAPH